VPAQVSEFVKSYNSFSGVDIKGTFGNKVITELQAISYSITREKAPIYTMGSADPRAFARGKRGIAGTLIFIMFDRHALLDGIAREASMMFQSDIDDIFPEYNGSGQMDGFTLASNSDRAASSPVGGGPAPSGLTQQESDIVGAINSDQAAAFAWYVDQIPPFDITLTAANEYGALAVMKIFGVEILNEGYGISIDDLVSEQQMTYVARTVKPWTWVQPLDYFTTRV
jgi:hypothetical protein